MPSATGQAWTKNCCVVVFAATTAYSMTRTTINKAAKGFSSICAESRRKTTTKGSKTIHGHFATDAVKVWENVQGTQSKCCIIHSVRGRTQHLVLSLPSCACLYLSHLLTHLPALLFFPVRTKNGAVQIALFSARVSCRVSYRIFNWQLK